MKRIVSLTLALVMLIIPMAVFADSVVSEDMQRVLLIVKSKASVPAELSEFSGHVTTGKDRKTYTFEWNDKEYNKSMSVSCDEQGRINSYYNYSVGNSEKKLSTVSKQEIIDFAHTFLKQTIPEAFENEEDKLIYDESTYNARGNLRYSLEFKRYRNHLMVKDNSASITLSITDDKIHVRNMSVNFEYDASFEEETQDIENFSEKYKEAFPLELIYCDEYNYEKTASGMPEVKPMLIYRIKDGNAGYISMTSGEVIEEDTEQIIFKEENSLTADSAGGSSANKEMLTQQELAELSAVEGLLSIETIEKSIRSLPYISLTSGMKLSSSRLSKNERGEYLYVLEYRDSDKASGEYFSTVVNANSGKIIRLSARTNRDAASDVNLTEKQKSAANEKMLKFIQKVCGEEFKQTQKQSSDCYGAYINDFYVRMVNGIKYVDNGISLNFDAKNNIVQSFSVTFTDGDFADASSAVDEASAYDKILEYSPITQMYIKCGGKYVKAATLKHRNVTLDAISGDVREMYTGDNPAFSYRDIRGHWVEDAATKLSEIQIGLDGEYLNPDSAINQEKLLRLLASGIWGKYYHSYSTEELYDSLISQKILTEGENAPDSAVKRSDAFVYLIRFAQLEKIAKLQNTYKIEYADSNLLPAENLGYCAILSGLGVICGDGGYLRPADNLSAAEAIVMLYRYLLTF